jgi:hypothetical protein
MEQSIAVHTFQRFRRDERRAESATRAKHRRHQEFLLPAGNSCELSHVASTGQRFSL